MRADIAGAVVDGNALAGLLSDVFAVDVTTVIGTCGGCGATAPLADAVVEIDEIAALVRCRSCTHTLFTTLRTGDGVRIVLAAISGFHVPRSAVTPG